MIQQVFSLHLFGYFLANFKQINCYGGKTMAFSLNKIMLIGRLGKDAETRFTTNNVSVTNYSLATDYSYKGKNGDWVNETTWHNVVSFNLSDYFKENLKKGRKFYVEGRLSKRDYTDKEGIKRYSTEVVSERLIPLEPTSESTSTDQETTNAEPASSNDNDDLPF
jgi:single-strand DNA-binding protein